MSKPPISETDLHAYVDAQLPESRWAEVAEHLLAHPEDAGRVQAYRSQKHALRELVELAFHVFTEPRLRLGAGCVLVSKCLRKFGALDRQILADVAITCCSKALRKVSNRSSGRLMPAAMAWPPNFSIRPGWRASTAASASRI